MNDVEINLQEIKDKVFAFAKERDWEQFHSPKNLSMAVSAEAAELMEHFLWQSSDQSRLDVQQVAIRDKVAEELADILIFSVQFANVAGLSLSTIIADKMQQNAKKYPIEKARGRSDKYTDL